LQPADPLHRLLGAASRLALRLEERRVCFLLEVAQTVDDRTDA
jgi:hypothetical protein